MRQRGTEVQEEKNNKQDRSYYLRKSKVNGWDVNLRKAKKVKKVYILGVLTIKLTQKGVAFGFVSAYIALAKWPLFTTTIQACYLIQAGMRPAFYMAKGLK